MFNVPPASPPSACSGPALALAAATDDRGSVNLAELTDGTASTGWITRTPQRAGTALTLDLGRPAAVCEVRMLLGTAMPAYARALSVATSLDQTTWSPVFEGKTAGLALRAALQQPREVWINVPAHAAAARFIRLRLEASHPAMPWAVFDAVVIGTPER
jgi:hypothetical protein